MNSGKKAKIKIAFYTIILFVLYWLLTTWYSFSVMNVFYKFGLLSAKNCLFSVLVMGTIIAIIFSVYSYISSNRKNKTKFDNWISQNSNKLILYAIISSLFFTSLRAEVIWDLSHMKNIITLCWSIIGISIAIFLVWNVMIFNYLKSKQPKAVDSSNLVLKYLNINERRVFFDRASTLFNTITLLGMNLVVLIISTSFVYINILEIPLLIQSIVMLSFYFCTNTVLQLFLDILIPLRSNKKELLKDVRITSEEVAFENQIQEKIETTAIAIQEIDRLSGIDAEEKRKITSELLRNLTENTSA